MEKINKVSGNQILFYAILWAVTFISCLVAVKEFQLPKTLGIVLSFLPTITFVFFMYHFIKGIGAMDEVQRRIQLEAAAWGFTLGILLLMTLGLLDHVVTLKKADWGYTHLIPYFFVFYLIGIIITKRKYD